MEANCQCHRWQWWTINDNDTLAMIIDIFSGNDNFSCYQFKISIIQWYTWYNQWQWWLDDQLKLRKSIYYNVFPWPVLYIWWASNYHVHDYNSWWLDDRFGIISQLVHLSQKYINIINAYWWQQEISKHATQTSNANNI